MGGHKAGDFASKYTVKVVHEELEKTELDKPEEILKSIVSVANQMCIRDRVDGPFVEDLKDITLQFRGSSNQRILNLREMKL